MNLLQAAPLVISSFLAGSIPFGYLIGLCCGVDVRKSGSGNPGATNVYRSAGPAAGILTLIFDFAKGYVPTYLAIKAAPEAPSLAVACATASILGHGFSPFLKGKGGKGVATSAGAFLALTPWAIAGTLVVFALGLGLTNFMSVGSMAAAAALPAFVFYFEGPGAVFALSLAMAVFVIVKHRSNIRRLIEGKEHPWNAKKS